ncbi:uncharacterized protein LOC121533094 isoform X1 [Coregonus clupeaformis]|uniref:uncharacterized protein LOC121533094 isoform X1 n=1 Tax=Coregonus clupeaformis TaxID=59861 RepID=UPI001BE04501|nr:uncharacterized protein LOC121533094 isoform X1 [Coregonus clupeaformis]
MALREALVMLRDLDEMESDGGEELDAEIDSDDEWGNSSLHSDSDCDSDYEPVLPRRKRARTMPTVLASLTEIEREETGKDGTVWIKEPADNAPSRLSAQNGIQVESGPTPYAKDRIDRAFDSFHCLCDMEMLQQIRDCTVAEAHRAKGDKTWDISVDELEAFIALLYVRGLYGGKNTPLESLWSDRYGITFFRDTMPRNRLREIMRYLRFDARETRRMRLETDKFALVSEVWNAFVHNCVTSYKPGVNITVEEQWFPTKTKCRFTQYIPYKQDKWGMKFRLAADVDSKYVLNVFPYLGKDESQQPENVVMRLVEPYLGKGRNVNTDEVFTSLPLANKLIDKNTSLVGVVNKMRRELPPSACDQSQAELFSTTVLKHDKATLTVYRKKPRKNICILSTMHPTVAIGGDTRRKPDTMMHYNSKNVGVDKMARQFTVKGGTRRWPVAVFYNLLDLAAINAHVLFTQCTGKTTPRRDFIMDLAWELRENHMRAKTKAAAAAKEAAKEAAKAAPPPSRAPIQLPAGKRTQCQVKTQCARNQAHESCAQCHRFVCGSCTHKGPKLCADCGSEQ